MSKHQITKATDAERAAYKSACGYPLYGFVELDGHRCAIEYLGGHWDVKAGDPDYEIVSPVGFGFTETGGTEPETTTALCHGLNDLRERVRYLNVVANPEEETE